MRLFDMSFARNLAVAIFLLVGAMALPANAALGQGSGAGALATWSRLDRATTFAVGEAGGIDYFGARVNFAVAPVRSFFGGVFARPSFTASGARTHTYQLPGALVSNSFRTGSLPLDAYTLTVVARASGTWSLEGYTRPPHVSLPVSSVEVPEIWTVMLVALALVGLRLRGASRLASERHIKLNGEDRVNHSSANAIRSAISERASFRPPEHV